MKNKYLTTIGLSLLIPFLTFSQNDSISKFPPPKDFMIEIDFNPFGDDGVFSFENLQTKYWLNNKTALRLGLQFDYKNNSTSKEDYESHESYKPTVSEKSFLFGFKPGIEFRILGESRISPYWGAEFSFINKSSESKYVDYERKIDSDINDFTYNKVETKLSRAWRKVTFQELESSDPWGGTSYRTYQSTDYTHERAFSSYGLNLILGTDFFLISNLYLGFEIGLGYEIKKYKKIELETIDNRESDPNYPTISIDDKLTYPSSRSTVFGFYYNNSIRLGVYF